VQNRLRSVLRLDDDHVGLGEALFDVAALETPRLAVELAPADRLLRVDERLQISHSTSISSSAARACPSVSAARRDRRALEAGELLEHVHVARHDCGADARRLERAETSIRCTRACA